jgi:hypothetical protein
MQGFRDRTLRAAEALAALALFGSMVFAQAAPAAPPKLLSPDIHPDHTVTLSLYAPQAQVVTLNGTWPMWPGTQDIKMTKDATGVWTTTVGPLDDQLWAYTFSVDGIKTLDPNNSETQRDGGHFYSLLMIPGPDDALWTFNADEPHGTVMQAWYPSPTLHELALRDRGRSHRRVNGFVHDQNSMRKVAWPCRLLICDPRLITWPNVESSTSVSGPFSCVRLNALK